MSNADPCTSTPTAVQASSEFARALHAQVRRHPADAAGVEHEYRVIRGVEQVDFRTMVHELHLGARDLDPIDPNAYHLASGNVITADSREAEVVTPPVTLSGEYATEIERLADAGRRELETRLMPGDRLDGYSTHVSVTVPVPSSDAVARLYARTFAPALILLMDRPDSPGLLIRPRPARVELCGEYVSGADLRAVITFAVGSVRACLRASSGMDPNPPAVRLGVEAAKARHGWYVDRTSPGTDLCSLGRQTPLVRPNGARITAQAHLEECWRSARNALQHDGLAGSADVAHVDALVAGRAALACESARPDLAATDGGSEPAAHPFGALVHPMTRTSFGVAAVMITWQTVVMLVVDRSRTRRAFACVPGPQVGGFVRSLESGALDGPIERYLSADRSDRRLTRVDQAIEPGLYDQLGPRFGLLRRERAPMTPSGRVA